MGFTGERALYWWQDEVISWFDDLQEVKRCSLLTPNGSGKSSVVVPTIVYYWLSVFPKGRVVITTKDSKQLDQQIWPALIAHKEKFPAFTFVEREIRNNTGGFAIGFTTDEAGRAEGWHKLDDFDGPLLIICDEAKSIPEPIFQAFDRCTYNALLYISSAGENRGRFYESQTNDKIGFKHLAVGLKDCPHISEKRVKIIIEQYGPDHPFTLSTLHGKFMDSDADNAYIVTRSAVRTLMDHPPSYVPGGKRAFCDLGAGTAENVLAYMEGNKVEIVAWRDPNTMSAIGRFQMEFIKRGLTPSQIRYDEGGIGIPIGQRFAEQGWPIIPVRNENPARQPDRYQNIGAEVWHEGARQIIEQRVILQNDPILEEQMCSRRMTFLSDGRLGAESKKDMAKRSIPSPDRADAVFGVLAIETTLASTIFDEKGLRRLESMARAARAESGTLLQVGESLEYVANAPNGWINVWEKPTSGLSYLCVLSPIVHGEFNADHVLMIFRAAYKDEDESVPVRLVSKVKSPFRVDAGPLAETVKRVSDWYGGCFVVPVTNDRGDVIDKLNEEGLSMYVRENFEVMKNGRRENFVYGWETTPYTRSHWVGSLAEAIRQDELVIEDLDTVMELYQLGSDDVRRRAEAVGVALRCMGFATTMKPRPKFTPMSQLVRQPTKRSDSMIS